MRAAHPGVRLLVLSMHDEATTAERAFRAGAHGYAVKREPGPQIVEGIRTVLKGKFYASPSLAAQLAGRLFADKAARTARPEDLLSDREMEVFRFRGRGLSTKEIADRLGVSVKTVGSYDARIKEKLVLDIPVVDIDGNRPDLEGCEHRFDKLDGVIQVETDVLARADAAGEECIRKPIGSLVERGESKPPLAIGNSDAIGKLKPARPK